MAIGGPPAAYYFEDRTGLVASSDFDEVYDRKFLRVSSTPQRTQNAGIMIYDMGRRSTSYADRHHFYREPAIVLDFGPNGALGTILFTQTAASVPMTQYLRKVSFFGGTLFRKFKASDGKEYRWGHRMVADHEWTCLSSEDYIVAHYNLKPPDRPAYGTSGNILTVYETFAPLSTELLASLTIMRHIAQHNL
ncbi:hypothetical protein HETIRDRAFT_473579 [Heterobasidion irregulare TC 32-1]|uniref:Uncharacterized protein n=1 Tax=Heterobasidion irregulare (strain TC 32-1) TaxID=747525 RepID=W4KG90_HETIT|nr:uncharacterized protein HETIRDRAFT_473579 [Heterobasidion irregulare TC 32-1]ETW84873.1 hypothetical protein HETIRDRAFT_473579 [Heterobasidion irregulare TC 32-1]